MSNEIELKLVVEPQVADKLQDLDLLAAFDPPKTKRVISTYFDTEQETLRSHKLSLRLRRKGDQWLQTLKGQGEEVGGLHKRIEIEQPLESGELQLDLLKDAPNAELFRDPAIVDHLQPAFTTDFQRTTWILNLPEDTQVEMVMDRGEITHRNFSEPICEIELELLTGSLPQLLQFAEDLTAAIPTYMEGRSKAARGYALGKHLTFEEMPLPTVPCNQDQSAREVGHKAAVSLLQCLQANEKAALHHQSSSALQNCVTALEMLRCAFEIDNAKADSAEQRKLIGLLSKATAFFRAPLRQIRFHKEVLKPEEGFRLPSDIEHALWETERRAFDEFNGFVHSGQYARLVLAVLRQVLG